MPVLTRRRYDQRPDCWHVFYGDVHVGTIARRDGQPNAIEGWQWHCGFYPGSNPGEQCGGTAKTFEQAREYFERAWMVFSSRPSEADYQAWGDQRDLRRGNIPCGIAASGRDDGVAEKWRHS